MKNNKNGFTLVELSIVLVIIGLLIGGILVGQSLIESAKMQSFVRQMAQYDAATALFKSKFRSLPGDSEAFGCADTANNTCANGVIEALLSGDDVYFTEEVALFWEHLSNSGFKPNNESYTRAVSNVTVATGINVPEAQIGDGAGVAVYGNAYYVGAYINNGFINSEPGLSAIDSLAFDAKVDDGVANDGDVVVGLSAASADCNVGANYTVASGSSTECLLAVRLLSDMDF